MKDSTNYKYFSSKNRASQNVITNDEPALSSQQLSAVQSASKSASESYSKLLSKGSKSSKLPKPKKKGINWSIKKIETARLQRSFNTSIFRQKLTSNNKALAAALQSAKKELKELREENTRLRAALVERQNTASNATFESRMEAEVEKRLKLSLQGVKRVNHRLLDLFRDGISLLSDLSAECESVNTNPNEDLENRTEALNDVEDEEVEAAATRTASKTALSMYQKRPGTGTFTAFTANSSKNSTNSATPGEDSTATAATEKKPAAKVVRVSMEPELSAVFETSTVDDDVSLLFTNEGDYNGAVAEDGDGYEDCNSLETVLEDDEGEAAASRRSRSLNRRSSAAYKQRRTATRFSHLDTADQPTVEDQLADDLRRQTRSKPRRDGRRSSILIRDIGSENAEVINKGGDGATIGSLSVDPNFNSERHLTRSKARHSSINIGNNNGPSNERRKTFVKRQSEHATALLGSIGPQKSDENRVENVGAVQELSSDDLLKPDSPHEIRELEITEAASTTVEIQK